MAKLKNENLYEDVRYELDDLTRAFLVGCYFASSEKEAALEHLQELNDLAKTYGFVVICQEAVFLRKRDARTFLGKGKVEELAQKAEELQADVIIFDDEMSPNQQRNLENAFKKAVLDRTELILEIFSKRAETKEARLQIELAKSRYQLPRLKRLWTHLSRQTSGGAGFTKGSGEKQIEIDRRLVKSRVSQLEKEIEAVKEQRQTKRKGRLRLNIPTFSIIGYTNAGKSTLLRELTQAEVLVEDKLFATLDTTTRKFMLPNHQKILLIDTVGFIRKIPHGLVAAFRSTLEEALYSDILLHVVDASHPACFEQAEATFEVLKELKADKRPMITLFNKIDQVSDRKILNRMRLKYSKTVFLSAQTHEGFEALMEMMMKELEALRTVYSLCIPQSQYALISEIQKAGQTHSLEYEENDVLLEIELPKAFEHKIQRYLKK
ncbi:MAG: GTPase HflX [Simkaniaceae bacterium]